MAQEPMRVSAFVANFTGSSEQFADNLSYRPLRETLRLAFELAGGVQGAWVGIRYKGRLLASLQMNHKGDLTEVDVYAEYPACAGRPYPVAKVTALNPRGPIFADVFAG